MKKWKLFVSGLLCILFSGLICLTAMAKSVTLQVVGSDGLAVPGFRWLLEEDTTYHGPAGQPDPDTLALSFHKSYMPVTVKGEAVSTARIDGLDNTKYYFVSILPHTGYTIGGALIKPEDEAVTITVAKLPLPTAQITILAFEDNSPINNAPDMPEEQGLAGFTVLLADAGGRYGVSGGQQMQDAFGHPLGTTYKQNQDGTFQLDAEGNPQVDTLGNGEIKTDANGEAIIKYLHPGKYGVQLIPPSGTDWIQTSTIEGTKTIDAWVKANEPPYFMEFGPPGYHVFIGFVKPRTDTTRLNGQSKISGTVVNMHLSRPPDYAFYNGTTFNHTTPWIGLNDTGTGVGQGIYAKPANSDGTFSISNVPSGSYQLVIWDSNLDCIIALLSVTVPTGGGDVVLGDVPVFQWFTRLHNYVFYDTDEDGFRDPEEQGIPDQVVNLRFRDGSLYNTMPTDAEGFAPFDEVFPFFNWLTVEVDFTRFKATGATIVVDNGGAIDPGDPWSFEGLLNPQPQPDPAHPGQVLPYRTETGPVLIEAFQGFMGQSGVIQWGKKAYKPGENGGITGIVFYDTTRAEDDPRYCVAEPWQPGIPRVRVNLYRDFNNDRIIDDLNGDGSVLADADNYPFENFPGPEDIDRNGNGIYDGGDAIQTVTSDSWDDNLPEACPGDPADPFYRNGRGYDGLRNFNQIRPGVFDGGYAFSSWFPGGISSGSTEINGLPAGTYIVEAVPPRSPLNGEPVYEIVKEEDRNVDFGDSYIPSPHMLPSVVVGDPHLVPPYLSMFPAAQIPVPAAGQMRPLANRKQVVLRNMQNAAADFFMFTHVPVAGHIKGMILDDTSNEFDPNSPQFGEKFAPPWLPISIKDWTGKEISRVYSDQWGTYNALVPSTYTMDRPVPSGVAPNMLTVSLNDPGPIPDPAHPGQFITDPYFNRQYSQFSYTFQYMPGTTTYLDTPVVPTAAFTGPGQFPLDCEYADGTPRIYSVSGPVGGPYVSATRQIITITSLGKVPVPNPGYNPDALPPTPKTILRDYGFGNVPGIITVGGVALQNVTWSDGVIRGSIAPNTVTGQLVIRRGDNQKSTITGITITVGGSAPLHVTPGSTIQQVIDTARPGDLILVPPGTYDELVIMWKPVRLQGWGEGSCFIKAVKTPSEKLLNWRKKIDYLITNQFIDLLPAQELGATGIEPVTLFNEEGPAIIVLAKDANVNNGGFGRASGVSNSRIDGLTLTGADHAGGIMVNGYAHYLEISNNLIIGNQGVYGGGIRLGHPNLVLETPDGLVYQSCFNDHIKIHHNHITQNSALNEAGGGLALYTGCDNYEITNNAICGNFSMGNGGGIGHLGLSDNGLIANNWIFFNQSFNQGLTVSGGGIFIGGQASLAGATTGLSPGSGSVKIINNQIQGNLAGAGDGGGIRTSRVNGADIAQNNNNPRRWYAISILNNFIVNNVAGLAGGGISLQDSALVNIIHNTIANNDSTATAGEAFAPGMPNSSLPQPAGIVSHQHSAALNSAIGTNNSTLPYRIFSNPVLDNNIIYHNRSFSFIVDNSVDPPFYGLVPDVVAGETPVYNDLAVLGTAAPQRLNPRFCILSNTAGYATSNLAADPRFVAGYVNGASNYVIQPEITTAIQAMPAFDEGGNFIDVRFGPLTIIDPATGRLFGDYHLLAGSPAVDSGDVFLNAGFTELFRDIDGQSRPNNRNVDRGADERY